MCFAYFLLLNFLQKQRFVYWQPQVWHHPSYFAAAPTAGLWQASSMGAGVKVSFWGIARIALLQGCSVAQQDMDKYALYFILVDMVGCDHFYDAYVSFFFINTFVGMGMTFFTGWLTDYTERRQDVTLAITAVVELVAFLLMWIPRPWNYTFVLIMWQIR